ncbi:MAG: DUF1592 domain-containing protein, partial [Planctomycetia bacterium]
MPDVSPIRSTAASTPRGACVHRWFAAVGSVLLLGATAVGADVAASKAAFEKDVKPLLETYCVGCHNPEKKEGGLDLRKFVGTTDADRAVKAGSLWVELVKRVEAKEMPPEGSKPLPDDRRSLFAGWVKGLPDPSADCKNLATDETQNFYRGHVMSRRLTRGEYDNTVRDLFGLDLKPSRRFPADGSGGEGFDTNGDSLFTSAILMEKYLEAADQIVTAALPDGPDESLPADVRAARARVVVAWPAKDLDAVLAAERVLKTLMRRAYRRPVAPLDIEGPMTLFEMAFHRGDGYLASLRLAVKGVLLSPNFLFLIEPEPAADGVYRLGPFPLASRLSFFLWSSIPDDELLAAAERNELDDAGLRKQTRRMLADPRSRALGEQFAVQWLDLGGLGGAVRPDAAQYPEFDDALAASMRAETALFVSGLFRENRPLVELLDADYTYVDDRLAKLYGLSEVQGGEWRKAPLTDRRRGGVISQAAVLTSTSYPHRTSPVLRGKWVLENLLGSRVPPPPPGVPELPATAADAKPKSLRERLEAHRAKPECASCHAR